MNITKLIERLPDSIKVDILDFEDIRLKDGRVATRVLVDRLITDKEESALSKVKGVFGTDCVETYKYAPEIKKSYFYIV